MMISWLIGKNTKNITLALDLHPAKMMWVEQCHKPLP